MVLKQDVALLLQRALDEAGEHPEHSRQQHPDVDLGVHHVDRRVGRFADGRDLQIELVPGPAGLNLGAAREYGR